MDSSLRRQESSCVENLQRRAQLSVRLCARRIGVCSHQCLLFVVQQHSFHLRTLFILLASFLLSYRLLQAKMSSLCTHGASSSCSNCAQPATAASSSAEPLLAAALRDLLCIVPHGKQNWCTVCWVALTRSKKEFHAHATAPKHQKRATDLKRERKMPPTPVPVKLFSTVDGTAGSTAHPTHHTSATKLISDLPSTTKSPATLAAAAAASTFTLPVKPAAVAAKTAMPSQSQPPGGTVQGAKETEQAERKPNKQQSKSQNRDESKVAELLRIRQREEQEARELAQQEVATADAFPPACSAKEREEFTKQLSVRLQAAGSDVLRVALADPLHTLPRLQLDAVAPQKGKLTWCAPQRTYLMLALELLVELHVNTREHLLRSIERDGYDHSIFSNATQNEYHRTTVFYHALEYTEREYRMRMLRVLISQSSVTAQLLNLRCYKLGFHGQYSCLLVDTRAYGDDFKKQMTVDERMEWLQLLALHDADLTQLNLWSDYYVNDTGLQIYCSWLQFSLREKKYHWLEAYAQQPLGEISAHCFEMPYHLKIHLHTILHEWSVEKLANASAAAAVMPLHATADQRLEESIRTLLSECDYRLRSYRLSVDFTVERLIQAAADHPDEVILTGTLLNLLMKADQRLLNGTTADEAAALLLLLHRLPASELGGGLSCLVPDRFLWSILHAFYFPQPGSLLMELYRLSLLHLPAARHSFLQRLWDMLKQAVGACIQTPSNWRIDTTRRGIIQWRDVPHSDASPLTLAVVEPLLSLVMEVVPLDTERQQITFTHFAGDVFGTLCRTESTLRLISVESFLEWWQNKLPIDHEWTTAWTAAVRSTCEPCEGDSEEQRAKHVCIVSWIDDSLPRARRAVEEPTGMIPDLANIVLAYLGWPTAVNEPVVDEDENDEAKGGE